MSELADAVWEMERAAMLLRPFIQHTCDFNKVDTPDGDVCTCGLRDAILAANTALAHLRHCLEGW